MESFAVKGGVGRSLTFWFEKTTLKRQVPIMPTQENTLTRLKKFEHLFQRGHRSVLIDATLGKLVQIEASELQRNLHELSSRIAAFEKKYNLSTEMFLKKFDSGELGDDADFIEWFAYSDMKSELTGKLQILQ